MARSDDPRVEGDVKELLLDGRRGGLQVGQVSDKQVGQHREEPAVNEVGQLFSDEVGMVVGGTVAPLKHGGVLLFQGPRGGGCVHRYPVVAPLTEQGGGRVINLVKVLGQVGLTSERGDKVLPGGGGFKLGYEFTD